MVAPSGSCPTGSPAAATLAVSEKMGFYVSFGLESAFAAMTREDAQALLALPSALFFKHRKRLAELAAKHRLPAMHGFKGHAEAGDLMVYETNFYDAVRRAATFVDKILKGPKPADLPVERPTKFTLAVNMRTAKALGFTIPPSGLVRADRVIE